MEKEENGVQSGIPCALGKAGEWEGDIGNDELLLTPRGAICDFFPSSTGADRV